MTALAVKLWRRLLCLLLGHRSVEIRRTVWEGDDSELFIDDRWCLRCHGDL